MLVLTRRVGETIVIDGDIQVTVVAVKGDRIRLGPLDVFHSALLKPSAQQWRAILQSVRTGQPMPKMPPPGASTLDADTDARGASLAYRRLGRQWLRIDLVDRLASHAHKVRSAGGDEPVDAELDHERTPCEWRRGLVELDDKAVTMMKIGFLRGVFERPV